MSERIYKSREKELHVDNPFLAQDLISVEQITHPEQLDYLFELADHMQERVNKKIQGTELSNNTIALLFYQPSTRTFSSFQAAAHWLGCQRVEPFHGMSAYSSAVKGESLPDTISSIEQTTAADLIILRHPNDFSSIEAAQVSKVPIINAGSGRLEHPTQAILDLYTIREELKRTDNLVLTATGDMLNGRTIKSLAKLLVLYGRNIKFNFISPEKLKMPDEIVEFLEKKGAKVQVGNNGELDRLLKETDVLYVTRVQSEWFAKQAAEEIAKRLGEEIATVAGKQHITEVAERVGRTTYQKAVEGYIINPQKLKRAKAKTVIMHPLPRVGEISREVDKDPRAAYMRQMRYGLVTRMALMAAILNET